MTLRVTFSNKFRPEKTGDGSIKRIEFKHSFRCPVRVFIDAVAHTQNPLGWTVTLEAQNDSLVKAFKNELVKELVHYVEQRTRQKMNTVPFTTILDLSQAQNVQVSEQINRVMASTT
ncbi:MAG: hypothetical protein GC134_05505 [Proteobacteria bacterium]|nr:hypothetical protein [Pseudomonadota bacterium]